MVYWIVKTWKIKLQNCQVPGWKRRRLKKNLYFEHNALLREFPLWIIHHMIQCSTNCIWGGGLVPYHLFLTVSVTEVSWVLEIPSLSVQLIKTCYNRFSDLVTIELRLVVRNHWSFDEVPWGTRFQTKSWEDNKSQTHFMESQNYRLGWQLVPRGRDVFLFRSCAADIDQGCMFACPCNILFTAQQNLPNKLLPKTEWGMSTRGIEVAQKCSVSSGAKTEWFDDSILKSKLNHKINLLVLH